MVVEDTQTLEPEHGEGEKVHCWRLHVLMEAGYPPELAEQVADSGADLHQAAELVLRGCSPVTAARILL